MGETVQAPSVFVVGETVQAPSVLIVGETVQTPNVFVCTLVLSEFVARARETMQALDVLCNLPLVLSFNLYCTVQVLCTCAKFRTVVQSQLGNCQLEGDDCKSGQLFKN